MVKRSSALLRAVLAGAALPLAVVGGVSGRAKARDSGSLVALAARQFPNLTRAERAMLDYVDVNNTSRGEFAVAGPSPNPADPSNDPSRADKWGTQRRVRASLIRWLCVAPQAVAIVDPGGIRLLGARIVESLNLSYVRVPFALVLNHCSIPERINLHSAETRQLNLNGSYTGEIDGEGINVHGELFLGYGFHASGEVILQDAKIDGYIDCGAGHFRYSKVEPQVWGAGFNKALNLEAAQIRSDIYLWAGFESQGMVYLNGAVLGADLIMIGARIINPGKVALSAGSIEVKGNVDLGFNGGGESSAEAARFQRISSGFESDGLVDFSTARVGSSFVIFQAVFKGRPSDPHGLVAAGLSVKGGFILQDVVFENGAQLDISGASVFGLIDDGRSWPAQGKLNIDGLTYQNLTPADVRTRLRWIGLESSFHPQPYHQLAKVLRESGDDTGALEALVAEEDARFIRYGFVGRFWGAFLKTTVGYGHRPLLAIVWSLVVVLIGWPMIAIGAQTGVMRPTWDPSASASPPLERLHPLLYSLDVFLPFVNLRQEAYWWPDADASGECTILGRRFTMRGSWLRYYLWLQILAGWLLSAIFVAGVTGLIKGD
jgi:hypothetical protein